VTSSRVNHPCPLCDVSGDRFGALFDLVIVDSPPRGGEIGERRLLAKWE
jgi:hypothetical protein